MMDNNQIFNIFKEELFKQLKKHLWHKAYRVFCIKHNPIALNKALKGESLRHYSDNYNRITKHTLALMLQSSTVLLWSSTRYVHEYDSFYEEMIGDDTVLWDSSKSIIKIKYNKEI